MRCVDVIRELSVSKGEAQGPAVGEHLARCPECAAWAARDARLGQLWDATRPDDPGVEAWEPVWGRICQALDETPADVLPMKPRAASRRLWYVALGVAQVAAVFAAVLYFRHAGSTPAPQLAEQRQAVPMLPAPPPTPADARVEASVEIVEIPAGELVVIRKEGDHFKADDLAMNSSPIQVDPAFEALNSLEAIAQ